LQWDGVRFAILHPAGEVTVRRKSNDRSCVLRVSAGAASMLLTGDIERAGEAALLRRDAAVLGAEVLLVPHHGGRTSTGAAFLDAVRPELAVIPVGYRSRFGHPHPEVLERLAAAGARVLRTDLDGAVSVRLTAAGVAAEGERARQPRYWRWTGDRARAAGG
jgi:competence protein ComEC